MWEVKLLEFNTKQGNIYPVAEWGNFCTFVDSRSYNDV